MDIFGNFNIDPEIQKYLIFIIILLVSIVLGKIIYTFFKFVARKATENTKTIFDDVLIDVVEEPLVFLIFIGALWYGFGIIDIPEGPFNLIHQILTVVIIATVAYFVIALSDKLITAYVTKAEFSPTSDFGKSLPVLQKIIKMVVIVITALVIFEVFGLNVTALVAGLGIGGLAVALAAKDILANLFGSVTVMADQPFKIGDKIKIDKHEGIVKEIGIRTTRIKTPANTEVIIPNSMLSTDVVENISAKEDKRKDMLVVLDHSTSSEKVNKAVNIIKEILQGTEHLDKKIHVNFTDINPVGLVIDVIYFIDDIKKHRDVQNYINMQIIEHFEKEGIKLARAGSPVVKELNY